MANFNIGDKVIGNAKANKYGITCKGWEGVVVNTGRQIEVQRENGGSTFWVDADCFDLVKAKPKINQKVVITTDGRTTIAKLYEDNKEIKTAKAKCCDDDTFDFITGAKLALERLMPREYKAGDKVKVIGNTCNHYTHVGNIITLTNIYETTSDGTRKWYYAEDVGYIVEADFEFYEGAKEPEYKVGDMVEVIGNCCYHDYKNGEVLTIKEIRDGRIYVKENTYYVRPADIKPRPFKVGDKVEVIGNCCAHAYKNGRVLTIKKIDGTSIRVNEGPWFVRAADIKLYTGPSFKVGDKVKVTGNSVYHAYSNGCILTLKEKRTDGHWNVKEGGYYIAESDFELSLYYNGKVVCVDNCYNPNLYTVGKVYEFVDGFMTDDTGVERPYKEVKTFEDWAEFTTSKFIPLVED